MKITGVAPQIAVPTLAYLALMAYVQFLTRPVFTIAEFHYNVMITIAIIFIFIGIFMVASVGKKLMKAYRDKTLMTDGLFKIFRNPMYSAYLLFIIPGIILLINSWLALTALVLNFILFRLYIRKEHAYLEQRFGIEYQKYLDKVWLKFL